MYQNSIIRFSSRLTKLRFAASKKPEITHKKMTFQALGTNAGALIGALHGTNIVLTSPIPLTSSFLILLPASFTALYTFLLGYAGTIIDGENDSRHESSNTAARPVKKNKHPNRFYMKDEYLLSTVGQSYPKHIDFKGYNRFTLEENGTLTASGKNNGGSLGLGHFLPVPEPTIVPLKLSSTDRVEDVYSGILTTLVRTKEGGLYGMGSNTFGNLGTGSEKDALTPKRVIIPEGERVRSVFSLQFDGSTNRGHSLLILADSGNVYACGQNGEEYERERLFHSRVKIVPGIARLGLGHTQTKVRTPELVMQLNPGEVLLDIKGKVCTSTYYDISDIIVSIKTNQRTLGYGSNAMGELGLGHAQAVTRPTLITLPNDEKIAEVFLARHAHMKLLSSIFFTERGNIMLSGHHFGSKPQYIEECVRYENISIKKHYDTPPLLILYNGKIGVFDPSLSEMHSHQYLRPTSLSLPNNDDSILSMELHGKIWRLIGKESNYLCYYNRDDTLVLSYETPAMATRLGVSPRLEAAAPTTEGLLLKGYGTDASKGKKPGIGLNTIKHAKNSF